MNDEHDRDEPNAACPSRRSDAAGPRKWRRTDREIGERLVRDGGRKADALQQRVRAALARQQASITPTDAAAAAAQGPAAERLARANPALRRFLAVLAVMLLMLRDYVEGRCGRVPWRAIAAIAAGVLYLVNPLDLVPDTIPGLGQLDDALVLAFVWKAVRCDVKAWAQWKLSQPDCAPATRRAIGRVFPELIAQPDAAAGS